MTEKRKTLLKWIAILTCVTLATVGGTLAVCFSKQEKLPAPGFTFQNFHIMQLTKKTTYVDIAGGDILAMDGDGVYFCDSMDRETLAWIWEDKTFTVISPYGVQYVDKTVNRLTDMALFLSFDGDVIYFIDNEEFNDSQNSLWRYDVEKNTVAKIDTIVNFLQGGMISPCGNYFALLEKSAETAYIHLYNQEEKVKTYTTSGIATLYFVTDDGTIFYGDADATFQSVSGKEEPVVYEELQDDLKNIMFNRDCTEIIANCTEGGCYLYRLEDSKVVAKEHLKETGGLGIFEDTIEGVMDCLKVVEGTNYSVVDVASFQEINLKDENTGDRVKLTGRDTLVYQEGSGKMEPTLAPGGAFLYYVDSNGDYFYTDTHDVNGEYHLLWEASQYEGFSLVGITCQKSIYFSDEYGNLCYGKGDQMAVLYYDDAWEDIEKATLNRVTDTIYFIEGNKTYYSNAGSPCKKLFKMRTVFPDEIDFYQLYTATNQTYCIGLSEDGSSVVFCKLYPDGSYQLVDSAS